MPRVANETAAARLARDLRDLKERTRGLSIHSEQEAGALREALADLHRHVDLAILVSGKPAANA
jgi:hypothetical protein